VLGSVVQLRAGIRSEPLTRRKIAESLLGWSLPLNVGVLETLWFVSYLLHRDRTTEGVGQPGTDRAGSELAVAHLALGVLGLLAVRFRGMFWFATVVGQTVFLGGVAAVNAREIIKTLSENRQIEQDMGASKLYQSQPVSGLLRPASTEAASLDEPRDRPLHYPSPRRVNPL
jgi:hypothetical protein